MFQLRERPSECPDGRVFKQINNLNPGCDRCFQQTLESHQQNRVSSDIEKIFLDTDDFAFEDLRPNLCNSPFHVRCRQQRISNRAFGFRQSINVELAVFIQRQRWNNYDVGRHHVVGNAEAQLSTQFQGKAFRRGIL